MHWRRVGWAAVLAAAFGGLAPLPAAQAERPNVLVICADDHAPYVMGAYGNRVVRTPNLDRLAAQGMRFDRAYCNSPVCTASRQSFLTGRYPRTLGVTLLETPLPESELTLADILTSAGYDTAAIGKMHFNSPLRHGFALRLDAPEHRRALELRGSVAIAPDSAVLPPWRPFRDPARVWLNADCLPLAADADMAGTWFAEEAAAFLTAPREQPFFLIVSFTEPHSPFHFPIEFRGRHDPAEFTIPEPVPADMAQMPAIFRDLTTEDKQGITAAYYTSVEFLDRNVGRVLDALDRSGKAGQTLVVYLGDHGYLLGQHGRFEKHTSYEEAVRAPLAVRLPSTIPAGLSTTALVEFIDIVPTVLEVCGIDTPPGVQGLSLRGLLDGSRDAHREYVFVEYAPNDEAMVADTRWKLVFQRGKRRRTDGYDPGEPLAGPVFRLYDRESDPHELVNLADRPDHRQVFEDLRKRLVEHLVRTERQPELLPKVDDPLALLEYCVQPRDVQ
jgi:choline-sulfatase